MYKGITHQTAKKVLQEMYQTGEDAETIVERNDWWQLDLYETMKAVDRVIRENPKTVADYKGG